MIQEVNSAADTLFLVTLVARLAPCGPRFGDAPWRIWGDATFKVATVVTRVEGTDV